MSQSDRIVYASGSKAPHQIIDDVVAKGWKSIEVSGDADTKRSLWFEATARGISVSGYNPTPQEQSKLSTLELERRSLTPSTADRVADHYRKKVIPVLTKDLQQVRSRMSKSNPHTSAFRSLASELHRADSHLARAEKNLGHFISLRNQPVKIRSVCETGVLQYELVNQRAVNRDISLETSWNTLNRGR